MEDIGLEVRAAAGAGDGGELCVVELDRIGRDACRLCHGGVDKCRDQTQELVILRRRETIVDV
jgi:hypothetical protein